MFLSLLALVACDPADPSGTDELPALDYTPESLEAAGAPSTGGPLETEVSGTLAVAGADRDWTFTVTPVGGSEVAFDVHSAIGADLATLDGREVTVWLSEGEVYEVRSVVVRDAEGVLYVADRGIESAVVNEAFSAAHGAALVAFGDTIGVREDEIYRTTYHHVAFTGDAGTVQLEPGEVDAVTRGATTWKVGAIAAWERELAGDMAPGCMSEDVILAYELLRVETAPAPTVVSRPAGQAAAHLGCG